MHDQAFIPFTLPLIGEEEINEVVETLRSGWLTTGPRTAQFEREFGEYTNAPHALAVNSCTAGLHLALAALGIGPGDEVITTPLTFCATVNTILHVGATPVLADIGPDGNIDPASIASRLTGNTRAIVPVHLAGLPCDMDAIWSLARKRGIAVIEDAAHAAGSEYRGFRIGAAVPDIGKSDAVAFSFYASKNLTTGEGGMVTTHNSAIAEKMKLLCLHGISKDAWNRYTAAGKWYYEVLDCGFKYNLSDIQSAIGIHQLRKLEHFIQVRKAYAELYRQALDGLDELELPFEKPDSRHSWHLFILRLRLERLTITREQFIDALHARGIGTSVHFIPIPLHPYYARLGLNDCPEAIRLYPRLVSLPLYPAMTGNQVEYVARSVVEICQAARKKVVAMAAF